MFTLEPHALKFNLNTRKLLHLALVGVLVSFLRAKAQGATDDVKFNNCQKVLGQDNDVLKGIPWHSPPLDTGVEKTLEPAVLGDLVIRWMSHENGNGTRTVVVLTRGRDPVSEDDPDLFYILIEKNGLSSLREIFSVNAIAFVKGSQHGVAGLLSSTQGDLGGMLMWNGQEWE